MSTATITFTRGGNNPNSGCRVRNAIKTYILKNQGLGVNEIAEALAVTPRSVYRYLEAIEQAEKEMA